MSDVRQRRPKRPAPPEPSKVSPVFPRAGSLWRRLLYGQNGASDTRKAAGVGKSGATGERGISMSAVTRTASNLSSDDGRSHCDGTSSPEPPSRADTPPAPEAPSCPASPSYPAPRARSAASAPGTASSDGLARRLSSVLAASSTDCESFSSDIKASSSSSFARSASIASTASAPAAPTRRPPATPARPQPRRALSIPRARVTLTQRDREVRRLRRTRFQSMVDYLHGLVVGRCLCTVRPEEPRRVVMLHADPLVSVDATQYAPSSDVPTDLEIPSLPCERHMLERVSGTARESGTVDMRFRHLSRMTLGDELSSTEAVTLLHLSAHGTRTAEEKYALVLENECGFADFCLVSQLQKLLQSCRVPQCVVLSACYSERCAPIFISAGTQHVVACRQEHRVMDSSARYFNRMFYKALFNGHTVRKAFEIAKANVAAVIDDACREQVLRARAAADGGDAGTNNKRSNCPDSSPRVIPESEKFVLLPEVADHDVVLFPTRRGPRPRMPRRRGDATGGRHRREASHPPVPVHALGRHAQVSRCVSLLQKHRCVNVVGQRLIGKSTVALQCLRYISERSFFSDGAYYVDMAALRRAGSGSGDAKRHERGATPEARRKAMAGVFARALCLKGSAAAPTSFAALFRAISEWRCLIVVDNVESELGETIVGQLLHDTHRPKILVTSHAPVNLGKGQATLRQVVVASKLTSGACRELVRVLAPWMSNSDAKALVTEAKQSPGRIKEAIERIQVREGRRVLAGGI